MKKIQYTSTLFYYEGPQVFEALDSIGGHYIALMIDPEDGQDRYLVAGVSPEKVWQFRAGSIDLRSLLTDREEDDWFLLITNGNLCVPLRLEPIQDRIVPHNFLPDPGIFLHGQPADDLALREARIRNNLVMEIAVDPPEAVEGHRIRVDTFATLLEHVQNMTKHAYGAALREMPLAWRQKIDKTDAHLFDVVIPAMAGSFRVVLEAARMPDMLGQSELARALKKIDVLFEYARDPQMALESVKANRGHLANAYLRFLQFLVEHKSGLHYSWAEPASARPCCRSITEAQVAPLVNALAGITNLGKETVVLTGDFEKVSRRSKTWGLLTEEGLQSGRIKHGGPSLDGLVVGKRYKFTCVEEIDEVDGTGRERRVLYLTEHESL